MLTLQEVGTSYLALKAISWPQGSVRKWAHFLCPQKFGENFWPFLGGALKKFDAFLEAALSFFCNFQRAPKVIFAFPRRNPQATCNKRELSTGSSLKKWWYKVQCSAELKNKHVSMKSCMLSFTKAWQCAAESPLQTNHHWQCHFQKSERSTTKNGVDTSEMLRNDPK